MTIDRLARIVEYSKKHSKEIEADIIKFCNQLELQNLDELRNVFEIVRIYLRKKKYFIIQIPLKDDEIGAFVYKGDSVSYLVINTNVPIVNTNFAICHELYHIFLPSEESQNKARIDLDYYNNEREIRANLFAGNLLMPENEFRRMFAKFKNLDESSQSSENDKQLDVIISLMNYFSAPFMAVYIRCCEFDLLDKAVRYLDIQKELIDDEFNKLWFDKSILKPSKNDNTEILLEYMEKRGKEYLDKGYLNSRTLEKALENTRKLFSKLKGE